MENEEEVAAPVAVDQIAAAYIRLRDKRAEIKTKYEEEDALLEADMELLAQNMLEVCKQINADSIKTKAGTVIRSVKTRYWTNNWDSMYELIKEHNAFALLERRLHQTNMKLFLEENPDILPMGLNMDREFTVVVRRSK